MSNEVRITLIKTTESLFKCIHQYKCDYNTKLALRRSFVKIMQFVHVMNRSGFSHRESARSVKACTFELSAVFIIFIIEGDFFSFNCGYIVLEIHLSRIIGNRATCFCLLLSLCFEGYTTIITFICHPFVLHNSSFISFHFSHSLSFSLSKFLLIF